MSGFYMNDDLSKLIVCLTLEFLMLFHGVVKITNSGSMVLTSMRNIKSS